ncbi:alpha/beta fold hydrolase [Nocardioides sp. CFH 31398]|uniref:alpha/beta fold hydrolase n=1 Tax=Nocardioides sp. CFH 31398 TaxID=2919579 RepID=UPI001F05170E|nr:alpha/beta hydrolase [Nocardioides sp. CFH 31398]MCH1868022.1 alpha/beta hydrolase [Nocardioides sp. CFH 31398]
MLTPAPLRRTTSWRGRIVAWDRLGSGPPLVMLHGTPWSSALWRPVADVLSERFTVHLWDMPGYGASSKHVDHPVDLATQGELFRHLLGEWGLERPHVVAHDIGGAVALRARLLHGASYASLCLVDVVALRPWGSEFFTLVKEHAPVLQQLPPAIHRGAVEAYVRGASHRGLRNEDLAVLVDPWTGEEGQAAFYRQVAQADEAHTDEVEPSYGDLTEPFHVVWGAEDTWIPVDRAHRLASLVPRATVTVVPGAGHLIHLDAPEALTAELVRWTESVR